MTAVTYLYIIQLITLTVKRNLPEEVHITETKFIALLYILGKNK